MKITMDGFYKVGSAVHNSRKMHVIVFSIFGSTIEIIIKTRS